MTHKAEDILNLLHLQETHAPDVAMPLVPLFETIRDLQRGAEILEELLANPTYRKYLEVHHNHQQVVMIGYSDSTKDGGYLAANWALYQGQESMLAAAAKYGVKLLFFHGRGGALGRGGGPAARGILSLPPRSTDTGMRLTEQGEVLSARYDDPLVAQRHLEQLTWALFQTQMARAGSNSALAQSAKAAWLDLMNRMGEGSYKVYRALVESPGFLEFFRQGTPIEGIEYLQIGSRPSRRSADAPAGLSSLRASPWVFSWTQNRVLLPAWYGLGTALQDSREPAALQEMYREWPFFTAVLDNAILALAKADFGIVAEYATAVESETARQTIWRLLSEEYQRTLEQVLAIVGQAELLDSVPWLKRSIQVRNPYVDPLNLVQVETMRRLRSPLADDQALHYRNLLRMTIQGIAGGLRTTG
jgi:phosphoenolpyruvate carboxylase